MSEVEQDGEGDILYEEPSLFILVVLIAGLALALVLELLCDAVTAVARFAWFAVTIVVGAVLGACGIATGCCALANGPNDD